MLEFQSDLEYLIDPPPGYLLAGVDLLGELSDLRDQVTSGNVTGEIDFENSIEMILGKAHDGHLTYVLDGLSVFEAARSTGSLVSISLDGVETPKVYLYGMWSLFRNPLLSLTPRQEMFCTMRTVPAHFQLLFLRSMVLMSANSFSTWPKTRPLVPCRIRTLYIIHSSGLGIVEHRTSEMVQVLSCSLYHHRSIYTQTSPSRMGL